MTAALSLQDRDQPDTGHDTEACPHCGVSPAHGIRACEYCGLAEHPGTDDLAALIRWFVDVAERKPLALVPMLLQMRGMTTREIGAAIGITHTGARKRMHGRDIFEEMRSAISEQNSRS